MIRAGEFYNPAGDRVEITTVSLYTTGFYGEYGFSDRLTGIVYLPLFVRSTLNEIRFRQSGDVVPGDAVNSIGDADIGLKYGLITDRPIVVSASVLLGLPIGKTSGGETGILQTGDGEFNQLVRIEASTGVGNAYFTLLAGFNNRTNDFSDEVHYGFEVGYTFKEKLLGLVKVNGVSSLNNGNASGSAGSTIFSNNTEFISIAPEINYNLNDKWGVSGSAAIAVSGKNILAAPNYNLGVFYNL